jgi:hypothetical protein
MNHFDLGFSCHCDACTVLVDRSHATARAGEEDHFRSIRKAQRGLCRSISVDGAAWVDSPAFHRIRQCRSPMEAEPMSASENERRRD